MHYLFVYDSQSLLGRVAVALQVCSSPFLMSQAFYKLVQLPIVLIYQENNLFAVYDLLHLLNVVNERQ